VSATAYIDPAARSRINDVRSRLVDLRRERTRIMDAQRDAKAVLQRTGLHGDADAIVSTPEFKRAEALTRDLTEVDLKIASVQQEENYLLGRLSGVEGSGRRENFLTDPHTLEELRLLAHSSEPIGRKVLGESHSRDELLGRYERRRMAAGIAIEGIDQFGGQFMAAAGDVTLPSDNARTRFYGIVPALRRRLSILDLVPTAPMDVGTFDYLQENGSFDTGPAETSELTLKPSGNLATTDAQVKAVTIPVWQRASRPQLADVPALQTTIETRLLYQVERRLEHQIIAGDGTGQNILGITNTTGIGAPASVTGDTANADLVLNALGSVLTSEAEPNAVCLNPADAIKMWKLKTSGSGQRLDSDGAFATVPDQMWGLPLVLNTGVTAGHALVGDFAQGATVFIRQGLTTLVSDSDQSDFISNAIKILVEMRAGLAVWRPACFAYIPLSFAA
jgi:HK97 family phage major capsid protein